MTQQREVSEVHRDAVIGRRICAPEERHLSRPACTHPRRRARRQSQLRPWRSNSRATDRPARSAATRTDLRVRRRRSSAVPCEQFSRAQSIPAATSASSTPGSISRRAKCRDDLRAPGEHPAAMLAASFRSSRPVRLLVPRSRLPRSTQLHAAPDGHVDAHHRHWPRRFSGEKGLPRATPWATADAPSPFASIAGLPLSMRSSILSLLSRWRLGPVGGISHRGVTEPTGSGAQPSGGRLVAPSKSVRGGPDTGDALQPRR